MARLLHEYLTGSARRYPDRLAVCDRDRSMTYAELDAASDRVAALLARGGVRPGDRVGLYFPKSLESIVAVCAIHKAGAAYVPVDPKAPPARAAYILQDCRVSALFASNAHLAALTEAAEWESPPRLVVVTDRVADATPTFARQLVSFDAQAAGPRPLLPARRIDSDLAYILYTSGSTGQPKGVMLSHRHAVNFVDWAADTMQLSEHDVFSSHAPLHFDLSVFDVFAALKSGGTLKLVPDALAPFPSRMSAWIEEESISVWYSVPSALTLMLTRGGLAERDLSRLRIVLFAGEVFPMKYLSMLHKALPDARLLNLYGPTETNVCTFYEVPENLGRVGESLPIGKACANMETFVLADDGREAMPGEEGELLARGACVMMGYWGRPDLTAERLYQNPLHEGFDDPVYATGDIVRVAEDGNYLFVGRRDHMVKSRGYRIELGEVENTLYQDARVGEAAVLAIPDETVGCRLMAVVAPADGAALDEAEMRRHCASHLPRYMLPERFVLLDELPKTSTGKTDRQALQTHLEAGAGVDPSGDVGRRASASGDSA